MTWLDIIIAVFLGVLFIIGLKRGLIGFIFPLAGVVFAFALAFHFYQPLAVSLSQWIENPAYAKIAAFAAIFILVMLAAFALVSLVRFILRLLFLGWADRLCGAFVGLAIGGLVPAAILALLTKFHFTAVDNTLQESNLAAFLLDAFNSVLSVLPAEYDTVRQFFG